MKTLITAFLFILYVGNSNAAIPLNNFPSNPNAANLLFPIGKEGKTISLLELSTISRANLETLTGRKMNMFERMAFKSSQKKIKRGLNENGEVVGKKLKKLFDEPKGPGFDGGGFALGLVLGGIGVLIAYLIKDGDNKNRQKWAWIGFGVNAILSIILVIAILNSFPW